MPKLLNYSGLVTKIKAMESKLLDHDAFEYISNFESTAEYITYLKTRSSYEEFFEKYEDHELHREEIEKLLTYSIYESFTKIYRFSNQYQRKVLSFIFFRYEVNFLKRYLQNILQEEPSSLDLSIFESFFIKHSDLNLNDLSTCKNIEEFIQHLKGTKYFKLFDHIYNINNNATLHDYEIQLDVFYFTHVWKLKEKFLKGADKKIFTNILGTQIDLLNVLWIYRSKKYYDMDSNKIYANIIPISYRIKKEKLKKMIESVSEEDVIKELVSSPYKELTEGITPQNIEHVFGHAIDKTYELYAIKQTYSIAPVLNYMHKKELELKSLITALECIRYHLGHTETMKYINQ